MKHIPSQYNYALSMIMVLSLNVSHALLPGRKKLSLNLATSKNASLTSRGHWSLDVPSQRIIHRSMKFVSFALVLVPVFWHFR